MWFHGRFAILDCMNRMAQDPSASPPDTFRVALVLALVSGILLGCAFPPVNATWLVWIGLVPLVVAIVQTPRPHQALLLGALAGTVCGLIALHPLVSASAWSGWVTETEASLAARVARQAVFLHLVCTLFAFLGGGIFWGLWAGSLKRWARAPWQLMVVGPSLWVVGPEWARAQITFGFGWAFLGNPCAAWPAIRQLAALGGV